MKLQIDRESIDRWTALAIFVVAIFTVLVVPLRISGYGYIPADDAMRHCAFAVDSRIWGDVLVIRPEIHQDVDSHPGWHAMLRFAHRNLGFGVEDLVVLSYIFTFTVFGLAGILVSRRPLAWMAALALATVFLPELAFRLLLGRPFAISSTALVIILFYWARNPRPSWTSAVLWNALPLSLAIWLHPSWYLWLMVAGGLCLSTGFRSMLQFLTALAVGVLMAAAFAWDAYSIIFYPVQHFILSLAQDPIVRTSLVGEFQPNAGSQAAVYIAVFFLIVVRYIFKQQPGRVFSPPFMVASLGWVLGLYVTRFWLDWGAPAFLVWLTLQIDSLCERIPGQNARLAMVFGAVGVVGLGMTSDIGGRYSSALKNALLTLPKEKLQRFMPADGGVMYTTDMHFFYATYYRLPHQHFRYVIGFEPGMMRSEDLQILRRIQFNDSIEETYEPWVKRMTKKDRIMIRSGSEPRTKGVKYEAVYGGYWIGKLEPQKAEKSDKANAPADDKQDAAKPSIEDKRQPVEKEKDTPKREPAPAA